MEGVSSCGMLQVETSEREDTKARLEELAERANEEHRAAEDSVKQSVFHAIRAGEALLQAKSLCVHGTWSLWLRQNFKGRDRTANLYMQLAGTYGDDPQRVANLSLRRAVESLREADRAAGALKPSNGRDRQEREDSRRRYGGWVAGAELARFNAMLGDARRAARAAWTIAEVAQDAVRMATLAKKGLRKHKANTVDELPVKVQAEVRRFGDLILYNCWGELAARMEEALKLVRPVRVTITKGTRRSV